jgi:hypothetical protein
MSRSCGVCGARRGFIHGTNRRMARQLRSLWCMRAKSRRTLRSAAPRVRKSIVYECTPLRSLQTCTSEPWGANQKCCSINSQIINSPGFSAGGTGSARLPRLLGCRRLGRHGRGGSHGARIRSPRLAWSRYQVPALQVRSAGRVAWRGSLRCGLGGMVPVSNLLGAHLLVHLRPRVPLRRPGLKLPE